MEASGTTPDPNKPPDPNASQAPPDQQPTAQTLQELAASDDPQATNKLLLQLIEKQDAQRADVAKLRQESAARSAGTVTAATSVTIPTEEEKTQARLAEIENVPFYCPACGDTSTVPRECRGECGRRGSDHVKQVGPIEYVSTDELKSGNADSHTPAPASA